METQPTLERPSWWTDELSGDWEQVREAARRDWEQTQEEAIPRTPPAPEPVLGDWAEVEPPIAFGYAASRVFGTTHPHWDPEIEARLRRDWDSTHEPADQNWGDAKAWIRQGYEEIE
jgi:hypothetical protein